MRRYVKLSLQKVINVNNNYINKHKKKFGKKYNQK